MHRRHLPLTAVGLGLALVVAATTAAAGSAPSASRSRPAATPQGDLTTYGYGNAREGRDTVDPAIRALSAHTSWDTSLDGSVYAEPLVYGGIVYTATENDSIYALAARTGHVLWRVHVGNPVSVAVIDTAPTLSGGCGDIDPLGITGTPVVDTSRKELFAVEETYQGGAKWQDVRHWLVAVSLTTHRELWHRAVDPPGANQPSHYYIAAEQQRPALTVLDGRAYVAYGGLNGDCGTYHGYVTSVPVASPRGSLFSYQVPTQREGGIWGTAGAIVANGDLYVNTGNGSSNSLKHFDEGNAVVELSPSLHRLGYWAPSDWVNLNDQDWDLGSASPIAIPGTSMLFAAGKPSNTGSLGYLMRDKLGGIGRGAYAAAACTGGGVFGADASDVVGTGASARIYVYTACQNGTEAILVHTSSPISFHEVWSPSRGSPNGSPIVAGGLVWALDWNNNVLFAMSPTTGHVVDQRPTDGLNHFVAPGYGDGELLVPTTGGIEAFATTS